VKNYFHLNAGDAVSSQAAHKVIQQRGHSGKAANHRYERRKVRELLRQGGHESNND
jgi:hypothetical protein